MDVEPSAVSTPIRSKLIPPRLRGPTRRAPAPARSCSTRRPASAVTLVSAPPGYGKSVAVASWLRARRLGGRLGHGRHRRQRPAAPVELHRRGRSSRRCPGVGAGGAAAAGRGRQHRGPGDRGAGRRARGRRPPAGDRHRRPRPRRPAPRRLATHHARRPGAAADASAWCWSRARTRSCRCRAGARTASSPSCAPPDLAFTRDGGGASCCAAAERARARRRAARRAARADRGLARRACTSPRCG